MTYVKHPTVRPRTETTSPLTRASLSMAGLGAVVGGTAAAAREIKAVRTDASTREEAVKTICREAAGAGVATGLATAVVGSVAPRSSVVSILGIVAVATGTKMLWDATFAKVTDEA
ncbi:MAG: hypothetical protein CSA22_10185 [Deltaproteobacteria bacterium]|nr:MAG: hypothetical protein CSA22_10185 [Deltaproteobacteria bacterium]